MGVSGVICGCSKGVKGVCQGCCMGVSRVFEVNIKGVRRQSQGCQGAIHWHFKGVTKVLRECYKGVLGV